MVQEETGWMARGAVRRRRRGDGGGGGGGGQDGEVQLRSLSSRLMERPEPAVCFGEIISISGERKNSSGYF